MYSILNPIQSDPTCLGTKAGVYSIRIRILVLTLAHTLYILGRDCTVGGFRYFSI